MMMMMMVMMTGMLLFLQFLNDDDDDDDDDNDNEWHITVFTVLKYSTHEENERNMWKELKYAVVQIPVFLN